MEGNIGYFLNSIFLHLCPHPIPTFLSLYIVTLILCCCMSERTSHMLGCEIMKYVAASFLFFFHSQKHFMCSF